MIICICVCVWLHGHLGAQGDQIVLVSLKLELQAAVGHLMRVLGTWGLWKSCKGSSPWGLFSSPYECVQVCAQVEVRGCYHPRPGTERGSLDSASASISTCCVFSLTGVCLFVFLSLLSSPCFLIDLKKKESFLGKMPASYLRVRRLREKKVVASSWIDRSA